MYLFIYFRKTEEKIEFETDSSDEIFNELKKLRSDLSFDLAIANEDALLTIEYNHGSGLIHFDSRTDETFRKIKIDPENFSIVHHILESFVTKKGNSITSQIFKKYQLDQERIEKERFKKWKFYYNKRREKERFDFLKPILIYLVVVTVIILTGYYSLTGEYKFIGQKTEFVKAEIVNTEMIPFWRGYYYQRIAFTYTFKKEKYQGAATIDKRIGKRQIGDIVRLKISVTHPERLKVVGYY